MKLKTIIMGILVVGIFWISIPLFIYYLNDRLGLPVLNFFILKIIGVICLMADSFIFIYCTNLFLKFGKGTPIPTESPTKFVEKGLYKYSRNPIYIGHIIGFIGITLISGRALLLLYPLIMFLSIHLIVVYLEEPHLRKKFSKSYEAYTQKVKRWI